ncbi:MAG: fructose 1,6-bisphosphatase [Candidatus Omnitrophota bacterium]|jgi:fructose 1,6-bisphosphatase
MKLGFFRRMKLVNAIVCFVFCLNLVGSGNVLARQQVKDMPGEAYMLRPQAASGRVESAIRGLGLEMIKQLNGRGAKALKASLADKALDGVIDPVEKELIEGGIGILEREGNTYIVCLIGNGWRTDLSKAEIEIEPFVSEEERDAFISGGQLTWLAGEYTPAELIEAQAETKVYLRKAGDENRIFTKENLKEQVAKYSADAETQEELLKRLEAAFAFIEEAIGAITEADRAAFDVDWYPIDVFKKEFQEVVRNAIVLDEENNPSFFFKGELGSAKYLAVTASSGGFRYEGYNYENAGQRPPRSIYSNLAMVEAYMEMAKTNPEAIAAYKTKLLHEYLEVVAGFKSHRQEAQQVIDLVNKYDEMALDMWKQREADKANAKILEEENKKTIAEATSANIGKFLVGGDIWTILIRTAEAELQKLVASGLLTEYRIVIKDDRLIILTTRKNSQAVEDEATIPSKILNVYLSLLDEARKRGINFGEDLADKSYREQVDALEMTVPLPRLTYLEPEGWVKSVFAQKIGTELEVPESQPKGYFTLERHEYVINGLLARPLEQIPDEVVDAIRSKLDQDISEGKILGARVDDFEGKEIDITVTHRYGEQNAAVQRLILEAIEWGCWKAQDMGLLKEEIDIDSMSSKELARALRVKYKSHSITERGSEPVVIAKMIGAGIGASNIKLYHEFFITGSTPQQKLGFTPEEGGVRGFRAVVRRVEDVLNGNFEGDVWEFEKSAAATVKGKYYPSVDESLELLAFTSQPNDFVITDVYAVEGSKITNTEPLVSVVYQPVYGEEGELRTLNPTFICRSQSGADAVGGVASMFYDVNFVPGGPNGENFVTTRPATLEEARRAPAEGTAHVVIYGWQSKENGVIPREEEGVIDHVAINPPALEHERELADELAAVMITHKDEQPYLAPLAAQARVEPIREKDSHLFTHAPKEADIDPMMDEVEARVASGELLSVTDDKADMGGKFGHNFTPEYMLAIDRATVIEAMENGTLSDGNIIGTVGRGRLKNGTTVSIGDDSHVLMLGDKSRNSAESHQLSFLAFTRGYLAAVVNGEKPYGLAQDYQGTEAKAAKANPYFYSHLSERFFEILREVMPTDYMVMVDKMEAGWKEWQETSATVTLPEPFSGNVSQQGIGSARYLVDIKGGERTFGILAGDKMGPAALNRVIREGVYAALEAGEFSNGLVFEIWDAKAFDRDGNIPLDKLPQVYADVADALASLEKSPEDQTFIKNCYSSDGNLREDLSIEEKENLASLLKTAGYVPTERIYLDAQEDKESIFLYLADSDRFNIKQVWGKKKAGWWTETEPGVAVNNPRDYLDRPVLGSSVTKLGILAGGEYIGKDDPVMVGNSRLMEHIFAFLKDNPLIIQGDMNGSHWLAALPTASEYAVASKESHPILVGLRYTLSEDGTKLSSVEDVFGSEEYDAIRKKMFEFNYKFKQACLGGQIEPYGTNWRTVEASYPLAKFLKALQAPDSPFLVRNKPKAERAARPIGIWGEMVELFKVATRSLEMPLLKSSVAELGTMQLTGDQYIGKEDWTGVDEAAARFYQSALALQSKGSVSNKLAEDVFDAAKSADSKVILISLSELRKDPSLIPALASINEQINQRLGIFGSTENSGANAYRFIGIADDPGLRTAEDVENLFAEIAKITNNGAKANKNMFASIITQADMYEGSIVNAADLLKQLERIGISKESIVGLVGSQQWTGAIKAQEGVSTETIEGNTDAEEGKIALAGNALFGVVEVTAKADRQLTDSLVKNLELLQQTATSIAVASKEINPKIKDEITAYREAIVRI